ncbi:unnamed protein product [Didymodactylos carnosus]|uniref:Uncharacterized protein n=1 Tax=Didymodactylos carnosus TaxID=1234261 RepID=A0A815C2Y9_9BILA|nr:unnamed protein product [Didymodactylos carnosus]CAF1278180.1 unnamed protein product [Didymodactylos carnosus]CAF4008851.1 unnamed protein product [Didymodactylos carnosus]CAF4071519.1 unnamed protein product [Didymodactylos carnosus]
MDFIENRYNHKRCTLRLSPLTDIVLFRVEIVVLTYDNNQCRYEGEYSHGKRHGEGKCVYRKSECKEWVGQWDDDMWYRGISIFNSGNNCTGVWNGNKLGGMFKHDVGDVYKGAWIEGGIAHGFGSAQYTNGSTYKGSWAFGKRSGHGKMIYRNGRVYETEWENDHCFIWGVDLLPLIENITLLNENIEKANTISCRYKYLKQLKWYMNAEMEVSQSFQRPLERFSTILETVLDHIHPEHMNHFINEPYTDGRCKWNLLLIAAKDGYYNITERLIKELNVNIEAEGVVEYENCIIRGASPLWCAAASGHLNIVKLLVSYGANVNHYTETHSTPLRAACFDGRLDIVKYLIEHGAD